MTNPRILSSPSATHSVVYQTLPMRGLTPPQAYELLPDPAFLLESVKGGPQIARYSFLAASAFMSFKSKGAQIEISRGNEKQRLEGRPFNELKKLVVQYKLPRCGELPPFIGGAVGCLSYDACHFFERLPTQAVDDLQLPESYFVFVDSLIVFDHQQKQLWLISSGAHKDDPVQAKQYAVDWVKQTAELLCVPLPEIDSSKPSSAVIRPGSVKSNFTQPEFEEMVRRAKEYVKAGDVFQVNLSQRLHSPVNGNYWELYKLLRRVNPSPFASYFKGDNFTIVSCSPERLVRLHDRQVDTRPIAGTRPRGRDGREDEALSAELLLNEKERAEHIMLVDLERNDLGRVCEYGSVRVNELMGLEDYSHVFHIVSNVRGRLLDGKDCFDVLKACFPGGTITGTPKIRSMEIIDSLEPTRRGPYTGSLGYFSFCGGMDFNIIIRTFVIKDDVAYVQVGAGIVADSDPEREYRETLHKAEALIQTLHFHSLKQKG